MYKLLIVDDEPLVQVGIKSMLNWTKLDIEVTGTAANGQAALKLIEEQSPDIVITDLKMPVMSGLELIKICRERYGNERPCFIILTSYEDFHMVKEALTFQVADYLIKLELTPDTLSEAVERVLEQVRRFEDRLSSSEYMVRSFYDKFFIRLLNNLFESEEQFLLQGKELNLDFRFKSYLCCYGEMIGNVSGEIPLPLLSASMQMLKELCGKYCHTYGLSLDTRHFALIFCFEEASPTEERAGSRMLLLKNALHGISKTLTNYYNVSFRCGIGNQVDTPLAVCDSYQYSRQAGRLATAERPIVLFDECGQTYASDRSAFNISLFKADLTKAFEEYDGDALKQTVDSLCELFLAHPRHYVQALDGACNILYLSISLLQDGEQIVSEFFRDNPDGYRSVYKQTNVEQIVNWLRYFSSKLSLLFEERKKDYKNHIVANVKKYINEHLTKRLTLNEVAAVFCISPNYLSRLFGRYSEVGFSEYINICKINESKRLLNEGKLKVYEVADMLGFESAFYFSKVFKKVEGVSPTEYVNGIR